MAKESAAEPGYASCVEPTGGFGEWDAALPNPSVTLGLCATRTWRLWVNGGPAQGGFANGSPYGVPPIPAKVSLSNGYADETERYGTDQLSREVMAIDIGGGDVGRIRGVDTGRDFCYYTRRVSTL